MTVTTDEYFGGCPECGKTDGYLNVGRDHWFFCKEHKTRWCAGANLFSGWRDETDDEQQKAWDKAEMDSFREVEPVLPERQEPPPSLCIESNNVSEKLPCGVCDREFRVMCGFVVC